MTKADLVTVLTEKIGFSNRDCHKIVELIFESIKSPLEAGEQVKVSGFGTWTVKTKESRRGRNPQTGEEILLDGRKVLGFNASNVLKDEISR